jgi:hypothetical protein
LEMSSVACEVPKELLTAQFRLEAFNILNRVDYSTPGAYGAQAGNNLASIGVIG